MAKYNDWITKEGLLKIEGWARDGLTDKQIAHNIGINPATLINWKKQFFELDNALKKGKEVVDRQVENALLKRALGYDYIEKRTEIKKGVIVSETKITKHVAGDTTAQIFWLKNRKPIEWRDKKDIIASTEEQSPKFADIINQLQNNNQNDNKEGIEEEAKENTKNTKEGDKDE